MNRHVLITVSENPSYLYGVRFVAAFLKNVGTMRVTLFYVAPPEIVGKKGTNQGNRDDRSVRAEEALRTAESILVQQGFRNENIEFKITTRKFGTVKDIIREGHQGMYDAVVLGRRGYTLFEKLFSYSVSREILDQPITFPVWICRDFEKDRRGCLVCVDGSEASLAVADHVGFMLCDEPHHDIILLHVVEEPGEEGYGIEALKEALRRVRENEVPAERVRIELIKGRKAADVILEKLESERCAVVAMGRTGRGQKRGWFRGSCSEILLHHMNGFSLWISR